MVKRRSLSTYFKKWCFFYFFFDIVAISVTNCFFLPHLSTVIMTKTPAFLFQDTLELFKTEKFFKLKQNYNLQPYLKFLQKKLKNWFLWFCLFFAIFCKIFIFFRKFFFFNFFLKNSFLSIFSSFYPILALIASKCQKFVILFKTI